MSGVTRFFCPFVWDRAFFLSMCVCFTVDLLHVYMFPFFSHDSAFLSAAVLHLHQAHCSISLIVAPLFTAFFPAPSCCRLFFVSPNVNSVHHSCLSDQCRVEDELMSVWIVVVVVVSACRCQSSPRTCGERDARSRRIVRWQRMFRVSFRHLRLLR